MLEPILKGLMTCYKVGDKFDKVMGGDGAIFEMQNGMCFMYIGLTDMAEIEFDILSSNELDVYLSSIDDIYQLLDKVDIKLIPVTAGAEVSYVDVRNQAILNDILDSESCGLSLHQAIKLKQHYLDGDISQRIISDIITGTEKKEKGKVVLKYDRLRKYFPKSYTPKECEEALWKILDEWFEKR